MGQRPKHFYEFGRFRLDAEERRLLCDGEAVPLTPKAFDLLLALVERHGHLLEKEELFKVVWPDSFVEESNLSSNIALIRKRLGEGANGERYIETVPKRGYRFVANVREVRGEGAGLDEPGQAEPDAPGIDEVLPRGVRVSKPRAAFSAGAVVYALKRRWRGVVLILAAPVVVAAIIFYFNPAPALTESDTVLLADFVNTTGDGVFDLTLKQALAVQLEQSPFLSIFPEERARETLRYMNRSPDGPLTRDVAREICERQRLKAMLLGSIASLGHHFVITLEAVNVQTNEVMAREQVEAENKDQVLRTLGRAASKLRGKLGESLRSVRRFDTPIEQATTSSLEALKAYSLGLQQSRRSQWSEAIPFLRRAVELDPNFALAYAELAVAYANLPQRKTANEFASKAFELRQQGSEREQFEIAFHYYSLVTRALDKKVEVLKLWRQTYPRDLKPQEGLANHYLLMGQCGKGVDIARELVRTHPDYAGAYSTLGLALMCLNRYQEAKEVFGVATARQLSWRHNHRYLYLIAFVQGDTAAMQQHVDWATGQPYDYDALTWPANTAAFAGRLRQARELYRQVIDLAERRKAPRVAAEALAMNMLMEATLGNCQPAIKSTARKLMAAQSFLPAAAHALALCGEIGQAQALADELSRQFPENFWLNTLELPVIQAAIEIRRSNPARAIQLLQPLSRYEGAGHEGPSITGFWPHYLRGQAYLSQQAGAEAAAAFQQIVEHRGWRPDALLYPLAHLGLARAAALAGDAAKSRQAYQDFFALWQGADPDLPILRAARQEYDRLQP
jgi:eukaryotic-like serine/threonine-protein kinase